MSMCMSAIYVSLSMDQRIFSFFSKIHLIHFKPFFLHIDRVKVAAETINQRTNGPVNAHLIYDPNIRTTHTKPGLKWLSKH